MTIPVGIPVVTYLGRSRERIRGVDSDRLLSCLEHGGLRIRCLLMHGSDSELETISKRHPTIVLPEFMDRPQARIVEALRTEEGAARLAAVAARLRTLDVELGLVFYGAWLPPELFHVPRRGFLNFHPAPLPDLIGWECDSFAILQGRTSLHSTVHRVVEGYDEGEVVAISREIPIDDLAVPPELLEIQTRTAGTLLLDGVDAVLSGRSVECAGCDTRRFSADRASLLGECLLRDTDTVDMAWRRFRAFNGQDIGLRLREDAGGVARYVDDLLVPGIDTGADPVGIAREWGEVVPLRCLDGLVLVRPGGVAPEAPSFREERIPILQTRDTLARRWLR